MTHLFTGISLTSFSNYRLGGWAKTDRSTRQSQISCCYTRYPATGTPAVVTLHTTSHTTGYSNSSEFDRLTTQLSSEQFTLAGIEMMDVYDSGEEEAVWILGQSKEEEKRKVKYKTPG
ncbi:hypothetical protein B9Z19DRAFT_1118556 [Tuber borchii]|uniref:Uncharacterized protein n=1 Tax=Tuber borchii TaxID=42251 RepID=A0A2T7A7X4_TUBBO|nr:hypothetical protein B9Z19DRAFT_1118556 [Tuber borchii]